MKKILSIVALTILAMTSTMSAQQRYEKKLGNYEQVKVQDDIDVDVVFNPDSAGTVVFYAEDKAVNRILFSNNNKGRLTVQTDNTVDPVKLPKLTIYIGLIEQVENSNEGTMTVQVNGNKQKEFKAKISGNGKLVVNDIDAANVHASISTGKGTLVLSGKCTNLELNNIGKGYVEAFGLAAQNVTSRIVGTGAVRCACDGGVLELKGSGTGRLYYKGKPSKVTVKQIGSLKAVPVDENGAAIEAE